jgi:hypothetical protein
MQSFANPLKHKPRAALSYSNRLGQFVTADSVFTRDQHPDGNHPFVETDGGVFEDGLNFDRKLLIRLDLYVKSLSLRG